MINLFLFFSNFSNIIGICVHYDVVNYHIISIKSYLLLKITLLVLVHFLLWKIDPRALYLLGKHSLTELYMKPRTSLLTQFTYIFLSYGLSENMVLIYYFLFISQPECNFPSLLFSYPIPLYTSHSLLHCSERGRSPMSINKEWNTKLRQDQASPL